DVVLDKEVTILNDPEHLIVKISLRPRVEEVVEEEVAEAPEAVPLTEEESEEK
ncbi:unnamed protein product, partial [marine sediment metagenome]